MPSTLSLAALPVGQPLRFSEDCFSSARFLRQPSSECANHRRTSIRAVAAEVIETRRPASSLYEVLRVEKNASPREIKSAYRSLAKLYHPDAVVRRSPEYDGGDFIQIRNAYETLSDPSARAMYDLSLAAAHGGRHRRFPSPLSKNRYSGFYSSRRWETDQCW
ncbi:DnaJ domain containing protein [Sesbania bispinosa]|nr:DnaJ domain containing protein [Sesbania bispinosa]